MDIEELKRKALFGCKCQSCAEERSMHYADFRLSPVDQKPICQDCYDEEEWRDTIDADGEGKAWDDLPVFDPFSAIQSDNAALRADVERLREAAKRLASYGFECEAGPLTLCKEYIEITGGSDGR